MIGPGQGNTYKCASGANELKSICTDAECPRLSLMCADEDCECQGPHEKHERIPLKGFLMRLGEMPPPIQEHQDQQKRIQEMLDFMIGTLQSLKRRHDEHIALHYQYHSLKDQFVQKKELDANVLVGSNIKKMLNELRSSNLVKSPYVLKTHELEREIPALRTGLEKFVAGVEQIWSTVKKDERMTEEQRNVHLNTLSFEDKILKEEDFTGIPLSTMGLVLKNCTSTVWDRIAQRLSQCKHMQVLNLFSCNIGDAMCVIAGQMKKLRQVRFESCRISQQGAREFLNLPDLLQLNLDGNPKLTQNLFKEVLDKLKRLQTFSMHLDNVKNFSYPDCEGRNNTARFIVENMRQLENLTIRNVGRDGLRAITEEGIKITSLAMTQSGLTSQQAEIIATNMRGLIELDLTNNNVGKVGAEHIACNLRSLQSLRISDNNIGTEGAEHIANNLRNLQTLYINGNNIGSKGAVAIGKNLKNLTTLYIQQNNIGVEGAKEIFAMTSIRVLNISSNMVPQELINPFVPKFRGQGYSLAH